MSATTIPEAIDGPHPREGAAAVDLYWLPVGAGASFVAFNSRTYEAFQARVQRRTPMDLYHAALEVRAAQGRFAIELTPITDGDGAARGVTVEGPVGSRWLQRFRLFRYELRCWRDGVIPDLAYAVGGAQRLTTEHDRAQRLLDLTSAVPALVWGRDELRTGDMWNSNSVISWLIARSELPVERATPPPGGRAPGWDAGLRVAQLRPDPAPRHPRRPARRAV